MDANDRITRLEQRVARDYRHLDNVMTTQRINIEKALDQVKLSLLEQEATVRGFALSTTEGFKEMAQLVRDDRTHTDSEIEGIKHRLDALENPPAA